MTPNEFARIIDRWTTNGGPFPEEIPRNFGMTTEREAEAVCRALSSGHLYAVDSIKTPALHHIAALFQSVDAEAAYEFLRERGLPLLREILGGVFRESPAGQADDWEQHQRRETHLFLVKILAMYAQTGEASLIVQAARDPRLSESFFWTAIFDVVGKRHPEAVEICDMLRDPLPEGFVAVALLDLSNSMARIRPTWRHPFDTEAGISRLQGYIIDQNSENYSLAVSATAAIPYLKADARDLLISDAERHPDPHVQLEVAWALAKTGSEHGRQRLALQCLNPRFAETAIRYLEDLGLDAHVPAKARDPDFRAMAEMCIWLAYPTEFGRPPDEISLYDSRALNWPPTGDRRRLWLFKYRYEPKGDNADLGEGIGLVGSTTFSLFGEVTADLAPEDVYGLHCCWELQLQHDSRAPEDRTAAVGRKLLAEANPDFPT